MVRPCTRFFRHLPARLLAAALVAAPIGAVTAQTVGYLDRAAVPDALKLLPPPPARHSPAMALDEAVSRQALAMQGTARFAEAARDARYLPDAATQFACAVGLPIDAQQTPALYRLLSRVQADLSEATAVAKHKYHRPRPFLSNRQPTCTPGLEEELRGNGSYPSGHGALGWAWALILSELDPAHATAIQARGRSYGDSRLVCNVHWQSDVVAGRHVAAATVARLHGNADFLADLTLAGEEIAQAHARGLKPLMNCAAQAKTLKLRPADAL